MIKRASKVEIEKMSNMLCWLPIKMEVDMGLDMGVGHFERAIDNRGHPH